MTQSADGERQHQSDAAESVQDLEAGGLPLEARRRLEQETGSQRLFASTLSVDELLLTRLTGYRPLGQVMGSSIYHVGWQYTSMMSGELSVISAAHLRARELAAGRLEQEAAALGAHGVVGVRLRTQSYDWGPGLLEFSAVGTAVRIDGEPAPARPFLCDLSGEEFWMLRNAGYTPAGLVMGFCSYFVYSSFGINNWRNTELSEFTMGVYEARHRAMRRLEAEVAQLGAAGVVGVKLDTRKEIYRTSDNGPRHLKVDFFALGTAISPFTSAPTHTRPIPLLNMTGLTPLRERRAALEA